tara:strand:- start:1619 stop:2059 length:441 start_codon:yes stop_codon:yes gene_type:complete
MKKFEYLVLGISISSTFLISTIFGFAGGAIIGTFWAWFWISFLIQVIAFAVWNSFLIQKSDAIAQLAEIQLLEQLSRFVIQLSCAYCKQPNNVPIQLNAKNTFKCESCNQVSGVFMQFTATTLTTPVESVKLPLGGSESVEFKVGR